MTDTVLSFVSDTSNHHALVTAFVRNKAVRRQYHTWFQWDAANANSFFGLFGEGFLGFMKQKIKNDNELAASIRAFLELGNDRNRLVHQDFASFPLEKTSNEIYDLFRKAMIFVDAFPTSLREFEEN